MSPQLAALMADREQTELAAVDADMHAAYGPDESLWTLDMWRNYFTETARVSADFHVGFEFRIAS